MKGVSRSGLPIVVDTEQLTMLSDRLRAAGPAGGKAVRSAMREAALIVAADAERRASFSKRIPGSIRMRTTKANFKVIAGGEAAPDAAPIENKGKGFVRHPVFEVSPDKGGGGRYYGPSSNAPKAGLSRRGGIAPWTNKNSHPAFLAPALAANANRIAHLVADRLAEAVKQVLEG